jgi:Tfp pilus assembly protein PilO
MWTIWLIGFVILGMIAAYQMGKLNPYQFEDIFWVVVVGVLFWPLVLAAAIIFAPFGIPFYLGAKKQEKLEKLEEEEKLKNKLNK